MHSLDTVAKPEKTMNTGPEITDALCDPIWDPLFWRADRIDAESAWCEHIPFAHWIIGAHQPRLLVELGTRSGVSYTAFCSAVERNRLETRCYAIDMWQGGQHPENYNTEIFDDLERYHRSRFSSFSTLMKMAFDQATGHFVDKTIDLLHINGPHTYDAAMHGFLTWKSKLSDRAVVLFHGTNERHDNPGVGRLWEELRSQYLSFEFLHGYGLGVLVVGEKASDAVQQLCRLASADIATIRNRFALLGERWEAERKERQRHEIEKSLRRKSADREQQLSIELVQQRRRADAAETALTENRELYAALVQAEARGKSAEKALEAERDRHTRELTELRNRIGPIEAGRSEIENELGRERALRIAMESTSVWRLSRSIHGFLGAHPVLRRTVNRTMKATAWTVTGQLRRKLAERNQRLADANVIASSAFFDGDWYIAEYPDAAVSDLPTPLHYAVVGGRDARNPSPGFDARWYLEQHPDVAAAGINPLVHYEKYGKAEGRSTRPVQGSSVDSSPAIAPIEVDDLLARQFATLKPLRVFRVTDEPLRVTMVTDSISPGSLFGGVATAIVFSAMLAKHLGAKLRLVTRTDEANPQAFGQILALNHIEWCDNVDFIHSGPSSGHNVPIGDNEIFVTTSWWTTRSVRQSVHPNRILYLLQEDERMFYPFGDDRLRCLETISDPDIRFVINTKILFEHLTTGVDALASVARNGTWFEPAFPSIGERRIQPQRPGSKRKFFFYARPHNFRNLYWRGLETIRACVEDGILDAEQWEFHFAGKDMHDIVLPHGIRPFFHQNMPWLEYVRLIQDIDVGLSLMDTPHPSYPPLDLSAAGAVVVTNRHGRKASLDQYSPNILCVDASVEGLKQGIANAVALSLDSSTRRENFSRNNIGRDWSTSLHACLHQLYPETTVGETHV